MLGYVTLMIMVSTVCDMYRKVLCTESLYVTGYYVRLCYLMIGIMYRKSTVCDRVLC